MQKKIISIFILILTIFGILTGCNKDNSEESTIPTFAPEVLEDGQRYNQGTTKTYEEKTEYGDTCFIYGKTSSVEKIKEGMPEIGDIVIIDDYRYIYNVVLEDRSLPMVSDMNGWSVISKTYDRTTTEGLRKELFGIPVKSINYCYYASSDLTEIKDLPDTIETAVSTFEGCSKIKKIEKLPPPLINAKRMFAYCEKLESFPVLPDNIKNIDEMFYCCISAKGEINIPNTVKSFNNVFKNTKKEIILTGNDETIKKITAQVPNVKTK